MGNYRELLERRFRDASDTFLPKCADLPFQNLELCTLSSA